MATRVLSIEIGQSLTHVIEMENKAKNPKVYHHFSFETPADVIDDGLVKRNDAFLTRMKAECEQRGIKTTQAAFSVNSSRIARRTVKIPLIKENRIQDLLNTSATDFFPVDMTQYHLVYSIIEKMTSGDEKGYRLNLLAVPNDLTMSYFDLAQSMGWHLNTVDYAGNSVLRVAGDGAKTGVKAILKLDENASLFTILKDGKISLQRNIAYGVGEALEAAKAESDAKEEVKKELQHLLSMISRVMEYYLTNNQGEMIEEILLLGVGAEIEGISEILSNSLNHKVSALEEMDNDQVKKLIETFGANAARYAACYGAVINPLNLIPDSQTGKKKKNNQQGSNAMFVGYVVLGIGIVVALALAGISYGKLYSTKREMKKVEAHIQEMKDTGIEALYEEYVTVKALADRMETIYGATLSRSEELVAFIEELEEKMPSSLLVINFTATPQNVSMSIEVDSKEAAAKTLMQLRTFDSVEVVSSTGLTDTLEEGSDAIVAFSVECVYKPLEAKEAE